MMKMTTMILMFAVMCTAGCFFPMEDLPLEDDATTVPSPDATPEETPDAAIEPPDAAPETPDAATPATPDAAPVPAPDATLMGCSCDEDCSDSYSWTSDTCAAGTCAHVLTDCGGMQVRLPASAATCQFWGGFGISEPAPSLGSFVPSTLPVGAAGGNWKAAPEHACSAICYDSSGARVPFDLQTEWSGATDQLAHASWVNVLLGTFDGLHME